MKHNRLDKVIQIKKLKDLLSTLDENLFVCANQVFNLAIFDEYDEYKGFIDIKFEEVELDG